VSARGRLFTPGLSLLQVNGVDERLK